MKRSAILSDCGAYRYRLEREWGDSGAAVAFIMLNPSTADATVDDPTIRRCIRFAQDWGYAKLIVGNLYALRATDPKALRRSAAPVGVDNERHRLQIAKDAQMTVCAWGANVDGNFFRRFMACQGIALHYLRLTKNGQPSHPLYLPADLKPVAFMDHQGRVG